MRSLPNAARLTVVIASATVLAALAVAQAPPQWGYPPLRNTAATATAAVYSGDANATFSIPIVTKAGRGLPFSFPLIYNASPYTKNAAGNAFVQNSDFPTGWQIGPFYGSVHFDSHSVSQKDGNGYCLWSYDNNFRYYDSGGTLHSFPNAYLASDGQTTYPLPRGTCHSGTLQTSQIAPDGSGLTLAATASGGINAGVNVTAETVRDRHGDLFNAIARAGTAVFEDTNGNYVSYSNPVSGEIDWTDTTGTTVVKDVVESSGCTNTINGQAYPACEDIEVAKPGSTGYATYLLVKANFTVNTGAGCAGISDYSGTVTLPVFLVLPQNSNTTHWYYQFGYDSAGRLNSVTFPSGGVTAFAYGSLCTYGDGSPASVTVQENDGEGHSGTTSYVRGATASGNPTMTISRPDGSSTVVTLAADGSDPKPKNWTKGDWRG